MTQSLPATFGYRSQQTTPASFSPGSISTEHELEASLGQSSVVSQSVTSEVSGRISNERYLQDQQQQKVNSPSAVRFKRITEEIVEEVNPSSPKGADVLSREDTLSSIGSAAVSPVPAVISPTPSSYIARSRSPQRSPYKWIVRTLADMYICEGEEEQIRYRRYFWHLFTISVFYGLPAFQLILTYQQLLHVTGNQDICYFNYLCSRQLGVLRSVSILSVN